MTTWPGALSFATHAPSGAASHASAACSIVAPEQRGHPARVRVGRGLGELGAAGGEAHSVFEVEHPGGDERGHLSERVAAERHDVVDHRPGGFPRDQRRAEHGELRVAGAGEIFGGGVEEQGRQWFAERGFGLLDDLPRGMVLPRRAHSGCLCSLTGEHDRDAHEQTSGGRDVANRSRVGFDSRMKTRVTCPCNRSVHDG